MPYFFGPDSEALFGSYGPDGRVLLGPGRYHAVLAGPAGAQLTAAAISTLRELGIQEREREIRAYYPELVEGA